MVDCATDAAWRMRDTWQTERAASLRSVNQQLRECRAEMKAKGIRRLSMMNGGHTSESMRLNERMFALETEKKRLSA